MLTNTLKICAILISGIMLGACQSAANISTGTEMNQTAENIQTLVQCPGTPNCVCSAYPGTDEFIEPIAFTGESSAAIERIKSVIETMPRTRVVTANDRYLHAEFTSKLLRFVDDVELLIDADNPVIHIRSASRVGRSDFGVNRKRVEQLRQLFTSR